jgi:hypothetical protein
MKPTQLFLATLACAVFAQPVFANDSANDISAGQGADPSLDQSAQPRGGRYDRRNTDRGRDRMLEGRESEREDRQDWQDRRDRERGPQDRESSRRDSARQERGNSEKKERTESCEESVQVRALQPLAFGTILLSNKVSSGFVSVTPDGDVVKSDDLIVKSEPVQAELELCGPPNTDVVIVMAQPSYRMEFEAGQQAGELNRFTIKGRGIALERIDEERWEGRLGPSGRARILVGATANLRPGDRRGTITTQVSVRAEAK